MAFKQPVSLLELSSCALGSYIAENALLVMERNHLQNGNVDNAGNNDLESSIKKFSEHYDAAIPPMFHNLVTYHTLQYMKEKENELYENDLDFDIVLRSHVTKFDFTDWPLKMRTMLYRSLSKLKHLKLLNISCLKNNNLSCVLEAIKVMKELEKFQCQPSGCFENIVQVLCDNCPLRSLNLHDYSVTDSSVIHLLKLCNLEELNINSTKISELGSKQLLLGLPQLKIFKCPEQFSPECDILTSLQNVDVRCYSQQKVTNLTRFCPSVVNLKLKIVEPLNLSELANLNYLTNLNISASYYYRSNINIILQRRGHQITDLALQGMADISLAALLNEISASCINLKNLFIYLRFTQTDIGAFSSENQHIFQNLESVYIESYRGDMASCYINLLRPSVNIRKVLFYYGKELCDEDVDRILSYNPLAHLQELCIHEHKLTVKSMYKLLSSCRELRYIGSVQGCHSITESELEELYNYVQKNNLNVEFVNNQRDIEGKKQVSVMKSEWLEL